MTETNREKAEKLISGADIYLIKTVESLLNEKDKEIKELKADVGGLIEILEKYGYHENECLYLEDLTHAMCNCGLQGTVAHYRAKYPEKDGIYSDAMKQAIRNTKEGA